MVVGLEQRGPRDDRFLFSSGFIWLYEFADEGSPSRRSDVSVGLFTFWGALPVRPRHADHRFGPGRNTERMNMGVGGQYVFSTGAVAPFPDTGAALHARPRCGGALSFQARSAQMSSGSRIHAGMSRWPCSRPLPCRHSPSTEPTTACVRRHRLHSMGTTSPARAPMRWCPAWGTTCRRRCLACLPMRCCRW